MRANDAAFVPESVNAPDQPEGEMVRAQIPDPAVTGAADVDRFAPDSVQGAIGVQVIAVEGGLLMTIERDSVAAWAWACTPNRARTTAKKNTRIATSSDFTVRSVIWPAMRDAQRVHGLRNCCWVDIKDSGDSPLRPPRAQHFAQISHFAFITAKKMAGHQNAIGTKKQYTLQLGPGQA
jgi:hypothetical protein